MSLAVSGMIAYGYFMSKGGVKDKAALSPAVTPSAKQDLPPSKKDIA